MSYGEMASVYDLLMQDVPYDEWVSFTEDHASGIHMLDMGCGTGEITIRLAEKGYQMTGVDLSEDMLAIANHKTPSHTRIHWLHQDIRNLAGLKDYDTVISYFDVLNYITSLEDLKAVFRQTYNILKPGGTFIFDVHSLSHLQQSMAGKTFAEVYDETTYIWFCEHGEQADTFVHDLTFFIQKPEGSYKRFDEYHTQRGYRMDRLKKELHAAGFIIMAIYADLNREPVHNDADGDRLFFICKRK
ncbi:class I SAM-dependent DNA methyltransferase [Thalassobacillus devorans]|uniref:class I SAM-dependent DNA methyltransferase n=1 Tax=Thalassobacillus devorans TaxID=279813 RepID=UPI000490E853|nr:class I SAM-dependent methyltransferase [Thalassobacillus devorans]